MTSSLVGSEMCIRDRLCGLAGVGKGASEEPRPKEPCHWLVQLDEGEVPVSYTHLTLPTICSV
eukprot:8840853-Prorocentrum_lima.AAC.1